MDDSLSRLRELVLQQDTVLFVGSGASVWCDYPTWPQVLHGLVRFLENQDLPSTLVSEELDRGDLLQAASYGFDQMSINEQGAFLREQFAKPPSAPSPLHAALVNLGPRCFITTNYDKLLEDSLAALCPTVRFRVVRNDSPLDEADIVSAHATDFIFKPHGDIDSIASIILTREHYRELQGQKRHAFETLKTLLVSRPVIFVGFGLRDPDFLLLKDLLLSLYEGGSQDHYALLPDVDPLQRAYWRRNFGMHLVSYETTASDNPAIAHEGLLTLINNLSTAPAPERSSPRRESSVPTGEPGSDRSLTLLRHLHREQQRAPHGVDVIPLAARPSGELFSYSTSRQRFHRHLATDALAACEESLILIGPPGSGKSFVMRSSISEIATTSISALLEGGAEPEDVAVPVYIELKAYDGGLTGMLEEALPVDFPLGEVSQNSQLVIYLDGLNEIPYEALDDSSFNRDLELFLDANRGNLIVLATRFSADQTLPDLPEVELDSIPDSFLVSALEPLDAGAITSQPELLKLLSRPVFFRFFREHGLPSDAQSPHELYRAMLEHFNEKATATYQQRIDLGSLFSDLGFSLVEAGRQLVSAEVVLDYIREHVDLTQPRELLSWLINEGLLVPYSGGRVSLFHHSMTEYMAALALASKQQSDPDLLVRLIATRRWDHALLLTLGFLTKEQQERFLRAMVRADPATALRGLAFLDVERDYWTNVVLDVIASQALPFETLHQTSFALSRVRVHPDNGPALKRLAEVADALGGEAVAKVVSLEGPNNKEYALDQVRLHPEDYNFGSAIGRALAEAADHALLRMVIDLLGHVPLTPRIESALEESSEVDELHGVIAVAEEVFSAVGVAALSESLDAHAMKHPLIRAVLLDALSHDGSAEALQLSCEFVKTNPRQALISLNFQVSFADPKIQDLDSLPMHEIGDIALGFLDDDDSGWAADLLHELARQSKKWAHWLAHVEFTPSSPIDEMFFAWAIDSEDRFFEAASNLVSNPACLEAAGSAVRGLSHCQVDWKSHFDLLVDLLRLRSEQLAQAVLDAAQKSSSPGAALEEHGVGDVWEWVHWVSESSGEDDWFFRDRLSRFLAQVADENERRSLLKGFPSTDEKMNGALADWIFPKFQGLSANDFLPSASDWLLADLDRPNSSHGHGDPLLATLADEAFVETKLLPLLKASTNAVTKRNLVATLEAAGRRHGRRYVTAEGEAL